VEVEAQHFDEDRIGLIHSDGEVHNVFLGVETKRLAFGIEDRRPGIVSMSAILSCRSELLTDPSGKICTICFPRINDALWMISPGLTLRSEMDNSRS
jgi:hypothetical protein